jgi:hypothetical protein
MDKYPVSGKDLPEIDLRNITLAEWRAMFDHSQPEHEGDKTVAKASGLTVEEIENLPLYDYRALFQAIIVKAGKPLEDSKNSQGESTK